MTTTGIDIPIKHYQELAAAIVEVACSDYIDIKIVSTHGYLDFHTYRMKCYRTILDYGKKRYIFKTQKGFKRQTEKVNLRKCQTISELVDIEFQKKQSELDENQFKSFFLSNYFDILMPNTNKYIFLDTLNKRAEKRMRFKTKYILGSARRANE